MEKESIRTARTRKVMPLLKTTEKENLDLKKKEELEENSIHSFEQIRSTE